MENGVQSQSHKTSNRSLFSCKQVGPNLPQLIFDGSVVKKVSEQKHLCLILDYGLSFKKHLNENIIKAKKI